MINDHKQCLYKDGVSTARIFEAGEEIPEGYTDLPDSDEWDNPPFQPETKDEKKYPSQMNTAELRRQCEDLGIDHEGMKKKDMIDAIHALVDGGQDDTGKE